MTTPRQSPSRAPPDKVRHGRLWRMPQARGRWTRVLEEPRFPNSFPTPQVLQRPKDVMSPWVDGGGVSNSSLCHLDVGKDTSSATHTRQLG